MCLYYGLSYSYIACANMIAGRQFSLQFCMDILREIIEYKSLVFRQIVHREAKYPLHIVKKMRTKLHLPYSLSSLRCNHKSLVVPLVIL